jgi:hypothetical protein
MKEPLLFHPAELAYALSYLNVKAVIGWGPEPFTPPKGKSDAFYANGLARLKRNKRLLPGKQAGRFRFSDEMSQIFATLADPLIAIVTHRKDGKGVRILTHYQKDTTVIELSREKDETFRLQQYDTLAGAAGAATAFVGASAEMSGAPVQLEAKQANFESIKELIRKGNVEKAKAEVEDFGADDTAADSLINAIRQPQASGVVNVMYCSGNAVQDSETYAVLTAGAGESWVLFPPASAQGPVVCERTSVPSLTARILVAISARTVLPI